MAADFLVLLVLAGGPLLDATLAASRLGVSGPVFRLGSPGWAFTAAGVGGSSRFWLGLLTSQTVAWLMLAAACLLVPRAWQEKPAKRMNAQGNWAFRWKYGGAKHRANLRRSLVGLNPVLWLACRERRQALALWVIAILAAVGFIALCASGERGMGWMVWSQLGGLLTIVVYLRIASQAGLFFFEAQRSGLFELLLSTPLTAQQIIQGQWRAMLRQFIATLKTIAFVQIIPWFAVAFLSAAAAGLILVPMLKLNLAGGSSPMTTWFPLLFAGLASLIALAKDGCFVLLARSRLYSRLRERAMPDRAIGREASAPPLMPGKNS